MKRTIPLLITAVAGFVLVIEPFMPAIGFVKQQLLTWYQIVLAFALVLGSVSLLSTHTTKIRRQSEGWGYSVALVLAFSVTIIAGLAKIGVPREPGLVARLSGANEFVAEVAVVDKAASRDLTLIAQKGPENETVALTFDDAEVADIDFDDKGNAQLALSLPWTDEGFDVEAAPEAAFLESLVVPLRFEIPGVETPQITNVPVGIGNLATARLDRYGRLTGYFREQGSVYWFIYKHFLEPLQLTMFALLAFYVASAAFRAFRARNPESLVLLLTAFIVLLGRTYAGTYVTQWVDSEGFWSVFRVEELTVWIMKVFNTAGNRAIMIGIALGIVSTSLKILLGIDRSYLGSD